MRMIQGGAVEKCEEWQRIYFDKGQKYLYSAQWKARVRVNLWQTTKPSNTFEHYIGHINRLCCAADCKN